MPITNQLEMSAVEFPLQESAILDREGGVQISGYHMKVWWSVLIPRLQSASDNSRKSFGARSDNR
jgi:hypothetical protein